MANVILKNDSRSSCWTFIGRGCNSIFIIHAKKHWFLSRKRKHPPEEPEIASPPRRQNKAFCRMDTWVSVFGDGFLQNPNIQVLQDLAHPDGIKFKRRIRAPHTIFCSSLPIFELVKDGILVEILEISVRMPHIRWRSKYYVLGLSLDEELILIQCPCLHAYRLEPSPPFFIISVPRWLRCMTSISCIFKCLAATTWKELDHSMQMGFPGCVGSTDSIHFCWDRCPYNILCRNLIQNVMYCFKANLIECRKAIFYSNWSLTIPNIACAAATRAVRVDIAHGA